MRARFLALIGALSLLGSLAQLPAQGQASPPQLALDTQLKAQRWSGSEHPEDEAILSESALPIDGQRVPPAYPATLLDPLRPMFAIRSGELNLARAWNPLTGRLDTVLGLQQLGPARALHSGLGTWFEVSEQTSSSPATPVSRYAVLVRADGSALSVRLPLVRYSATLVLLSDQSLLWIGGRIGYLGGERGNDVQWVRLDGDRLVASTLQPIPGPLRWGWSAVALDDGRLLLLGGSSSDRLGCDPDSCHADSHVLEPRIDHWRPGPQLTQARADAAALRLADGSVLVAGGWSRDAQGALAVTASSEIWRGGSRFEATAPMPVPDRRQRPLQLAGSPIDTPLLFNPYSGIVQGYDPQQRRWQLAAELPQFVDQIIGPLSSARGAFLWAGKIASSGRQWLRIPLRLPSISSVAGAARHDPAQGVPFRRHRVGLLAGEAPQPTLIVGGEVQINQLGQQEAYTTTAVVAIEHDGRVRNLPSLNHPRTGATVLRLLDGSLLVAGGRGSEPETSLPPEWLPGDDPPADVGWRVVEDAPKASGWGQDGNGGLLAVSEDGKVWRGQLQLDVEGQPRFAGQSLPLLPLPRTSDHNNVQTVPAIHGLADGRILVTGGMSARLRVAGLDPTLEEQPPADNEDAECQGFVRGRDMEAVAMEASPATDGEADAKADYGWVLPEHCRTPALHVDPDGSIRLDALAYADRGERDLPYGYDDLANDYALYDPAHGRWRYSVRGEGNCYGEMAVLGDGRVVRRLSLSPPADQPDGEYRQLLGLSSADGRSWDNLALQGPMPELWSQGGELFGLRGDDEGGQELLWLDLETRSWVRLRHWKRDDRAQEASFVLFQTSLPDGRRLWLPDRMPR